MYCDVINAVVVSVCLPVCSVVPEDSGIVGMIFGRLMSAVTFKPEAGEGSVVDQVLFKAERALLAGDLVTAATELSQLTGPPADTSSDFLKLLKQRLAVEQALIAIKAETALLAASLY